LEDLQIPVVYGNEWVGKQLVEHIGLTNISHNADISYPSLYDGPTFSLVVKTTDEVSTNKFQ